MAKHLAAPGEIPMTEAPLIENPRHRVWVEPEHLQPWGFPVDADDARVLKQEG